MKKGKPLSQKNKEGLRKAWIKRKEKGLGISWNKGIDTRKIGSCLICDKEFKYYIRKDGIIKKYCSRKCFYKSQEGENNISKKLEIRLKISKAKKGIPNPHLGIIFSEESKKKMSETWKKKFENPKERLRMKNSMIKYFNNQDNRKKLSDKIKEKWKDPEYRKKVTQSWRLKRKYNEEDIINAWNKGMSLTDISKNLNCHRLTSLKILKKYGIDKQDIENRRRNKISKSMKESRPFQILPFKDTSIEIKLQNYLKLLHIDFITHYYISGITHSYQCDILIPQKKIIIEADGCYWHGCKICNKKISDFQDKQKEEDKIRTTELEEKGYKVIRLWEHDINSITLDKFKEKIRLSKLF